MPLISKYRFGICIEVTILEMINVSKKLTNIKNGISFPGFGCNFFSGDIKVILSK